MNNYNYPKAFEHEGLKLRIEFTVLDNKYVAHKIFRNGRFVFLRALNSYEHSFFSRMPYVLCGLSKTKRN